MTSSARVTIREGNKNSFNQMDSFLLTFRNIPEGVTVMVPETVGLEDDQAATNIDEMDGSFIVNLVEGQGRRRRRQARGRHGDGRAFCDRHGRSPLHDRHNSRRQTAGADTPEDATDDTFVDDPSVGTTFSGQEWAHVPVHFSWDGGAVTMNADAMVYVSFYPVGRQHDSALRWGC